MPLGSVVALAERLGVELVATIDRQHFSVVRPVDVAALSLLPEPSADVLSLSIHKHVVAMIRHSVAASREL